MLMLAGALYCGYLLYAMNWTQTSNIILVACIAFFMLIGFYALRDGMKKGPVITINEEGVYDRRFTKGPISWAQIEQAVAETINSKAGQIDGIGLKLEQSLTEQIKYTWFYYVNKPANAMFGVKGTFFLF